MKKSGILLLSIGLILLMAVSAWSEISSITKMGSDVTVSKGVTVNSATAIGDR